MWEEALGTARTFEIGIYVLLGLGGIYFIRKFVLAWQELQGSAFGLERDGAQTRLNTAASALVLLLTMAVIEFVLVSFVAPVYPGAMPLPTSTLDLLATATTTLPAPTGGTPAPDGFATVPAAAQTPGVPVFLEAPTGGCIPGEIFITLPKDGEEVSGVVSIVGTANIPNFGFYRFEYKRPEETTWATISAGNQPVLEGKLIDWDTTRLAAGEYQLGMVMVDNTGKDSIPCVIQVRVSRPPETAAP